MVRDAKDDIRTYGDGLESHAILFVLFCVMETFVNPSSEQTGVLR